MKSSRFSLGILFAACLLLAGCDWSKSERLEWPVMGTVAAIQTRGRGAQSSAASVRRWAQWIVKDAETLLNAHDPQSELSHLASSSDAEVVARCSNACRPCYAAAFALQKASGGAFNPRWRGTNTLDLGAIAKGFAVDQLAPMYRTDRLVCADVLVDLGGNVESLRGTWRTGVQDPLGAGTAAVVELQTGEALATSATYYRGAHIVDGRTGQPVTNDVASVTVLCRSAMWADGLSTTLFILGPQEGRTFLDNQLSDLDEDLRVSVLWILKDGTQITYGDARFQRN